MGKIGCGKTNIISAIKYFYDNLIGKNSDNISIFDRNNKFSNKIKIGITYSFKEFKKIYYSQLRNGKDEYISYYNKIINICNGHDELYVELIKIKDSPIKWNIQSLENRQILYNIFPFYFINVRDLNLTEWDDLWLKIGDLVKVEDETANEIRKSIFDIIDNDTENKYKLYSKFNLLRRALDNSSVGVKKYSPKEFGASLAKTYFGGDRFVFSEEELSYFSDGTNSFNYINILIEITNAIKIRKIKFPLIIIDEPELGLHHKFIDMLTDKILYNCKKIQFVLCTHSARLVKNVFKDSKSYSNVVNLKYKDKYTTCTKMNNFNETRQMTFVNDEYVNSYFSRMFLLVEGVSELEVFNNEYLKELYPILKNIDIIYGAADEVMAGIILPNKRNYRTEFIILKDIDKIIKINKKDGKIVNEFKLQKNEFKYNDKEKFYYGYKRIKTLDTRRRIENIVGKCKFHYRLPFYSSVDKNYYELINQIKKYFLNYNTFILRSTIEGCLVNYDNYDIFWQFFKEKKKKQNKNIENIEKIYWKFNKNEKVNFLRLLVKGKTDYVLNLEELDKVSKDLKNLIMENRIGKTKWISEWLEFYFYYILRPLKIPKEEFDFRKAISVEQDLQETRNTFFEHFKELTVLLNCIYKKYYS